MGRFLTPDWSATPSPVPYASMALPQSLNLYAYTSNNPVTGIDPDGHTGDPFHNTTGIGLGDDMNFYENDLLTLDQEAAAGQQQAQNGNSQAQNQSQTQTQPEEGQRGHELMDNRQVQTESYNLFKESGYGNNPTEHSMWVTSKDGQYGFVPWPWSAESAKETWKGPAPEGSVAVVHTHPSAKSDRPSPGDHDLANGKQNSSIRMPVYVLHRNGIMKAVPGVNDPIRVRDYHWVHDFQPQ